MGKFILSESDRKILLEVVGLVKQGRINSPSRPPTESSWSDQEDHQAPETYIAKTPADGIPAISGVVPGKAACDLYRVLVDQLSGLPELVQFSSQQKDIHNTTPAAVDGDIYIPVTRSKFGSWLSSPVGVFNQRIRFQILSIDDCDNAAIVFITARPCGISKVPEESAGRVRVYDSIGCFFDDEENSDLIGREGWASYMQPFDPVDSLCVGTGTGTDAVTGTGTGTDVFCRWEVDELCCPPTGTC